MLKGKRCFNVISFTLDLTTDLSSLYNSAVGRLDLSILRDGDLSPMLEKLKKTFNVNMRLENLSTYTSNKVTNWGARQASLSLQISDFASVIAWSSTNNLVSKPLTILFVLSIFVPAPLSF